MGTNSRFELIDDSRFELLDEENQTPPIESARFEEVKPSQPSPAQRTGTYELYGIDVFPGDEFERLAERGTAAHTKEFLSGGTLGFSESIPGLKTEESEGVLDSILKSGTNLFGSVIPVAQIQKFYGPLAQKAAQSLPFYNQVIGRGAQVGAAYATGATVKGIETVAGGELPEIGEMGEEALNWAVIDTALQALGVGVEFTRAVNRIAKQEGTSSLNVLKRLWRSTKNYIKQRTGRDVVTPDEIIPADVERVVENAQQLEQEIISEAKQAIEPKPVKADITKQSQRRQSAVQKIKDVRAEKSTNLKEIEKSAAELKKEAVSEKESKEAAITEKTQSLATETEKKINDIQKLSDRNEKLHDRRVKGIEEKGQSQLTKELNALKKQEGKQLSDIREQETKALSKVRGDKKKMRDVARRFNEKRKKVKAQFDDKRQKLRDRSESKVQKEKELANKDYLSFERTIGKQITDAQQEYKKAARQGEAARERAQAKLNRQLERIEMQQMTKEERARQRALEKQKKIAEKVKPRAIEKAAGKNRYLPGEVKTTKAFERRFVPIPKEYQGKPATEVIREYKQTYPEKQKVKKTIRQRISKLYTEVYDFSNALTPLVPEGTPYTDDPRKLIVQYQNINSRATRVLKYSTYDAQTSLANGPGLAKIFDPKSLMELTGAKKLDREAFEDYLVAGSSLDRQGLGQVNPVPTATALEILKDGRGKYEKLAKEVRAYSNRILENVQKNGIISRDAFITMKTRYPQYAPLNRVMPESEIQSTGQLGMGVGVVPKAAKGSKRIIDSPLDNVVKNTIMFEKAMAKNEINRAIGKLLRARGVKIYRGGLVKHSKESLQAKIGDQYRITDEDYDWFNLAANIGGEGAFNPKAGELVWFENGQRMSARASQEVIDALTNLSPNQLTGASKFLNTWKKWISMTVVLPVDQAVKFTGMSAVIASIQTSNPKGVVTPVVYAYNMMKSMFDILGKSDLYEKFLSSGGAQQVLYGINRSELSGVTDSLTNAVGKKEPWALKTLKMPWEMTKLLGRSLIKFSELMDDVTRMAEWRQSYARELKAGKGQKEAQAIAGHDAFIVDTPYGRHGGNQFLQGVYQVFPFVNTILNGGERMVSTLNPAKNKNWKDAWLTAFTTLTIPTLLAYLYGRNDKRQDYQTLNDKHRYVTIWPNDPDALGTKIPKMWEYGWLFQTIPEAILDYVLKDDEDAWWDVLRAFEYEFSPITMYSFTDSFRNGKWEPLAGLENTRIPLVSKKIERRAPELQYKPTTSEVAKMLGQWINVPPVYIDHAVQSVTTILGKQVLRLADEAAYMTGVAEDNRPEKIASESILFGWLSDQGPRANSAYMTDFYDLVDEMEMNKATAKQYEALDQIDKANEYWDKYISVDGYRNRLKPLYKELDEIYLEPARTPEDKKKKRKELTEIYIEMTEIAKEATEDIKEEKRILKNAKKR